MWTQAWCLASIVPISATRIYRDLRLFATTKTQHPDMFADPETSGIQVAVSRTKIVVPATLENQAPDRTHQQDESCFAHSVPLTPLDLVVPKVNAALVLFFNDPDGVFAVEDRLETSFAHTLAEFPTLAGHLVESNQNLPSLVFSNRGALLVFAAAMPGLLQEIQKSHRDLAQLVSSVPPASQYENWEYRIAAGAHDSGMTRQPEPIHASLFALSKDALASLKHDASGDCKQGSWASTNDAVAALFWRVITRARGLEQRDDVQTKLGLAVNGREKIKQFNPDSSCGVCISRTAQELVDEPLGRSAGHLRQALTSHTAHRIRSSVDFLLSLDAATELPLLRTAHTEVFGDDVAVTQWSKYPLYDAATVGFGSGSAPFKVSPGPMVGDGVVVILPATPSETGSAGIEAMIGLTAGPMRKLKVDKELLRYATIIGQ
ncbi:hypothetical protein HDU88_007841 [Geranomyces variabilis]|nr:hypothetical protein HDU88_007841 [Geranomyces variabilis]